MSRLELVMSRLRSLAAYGALGLGGFSLAAALVALFTDENELAAVFGSLFGVVLLITVTHTHVRAGRNYRQLRRDQGRLFDELRGRSRDVAEIAEELTPLITKTVARDWSVNASRIAARYEVVEQQVRALLDELESRSQYAEERATRILDATSELEQSIAANADRLRHGLDRIPTASELRQTAGEVVSDIDALLQIRERFDLLDSAATLGGWAMTPRAMLHTLDLIERSTPEVVVECGSGASTIYMAHLLRRRGHGYVVSLEHDHDFYLETQERLMRLGLEGVADLRYAPLVDIDIDGESFRWYDTVALEGLSHIGVLVVDGPPGKTGHLARYPALPQMHQRIEKNGVVIIDDASRPDEKETIQRWIARYGLEREACPVPQLAVLRHRESATKPAE